MIRDRRRRGVVEMVGETVGMGCIRPYFVVGKRRGTGLAE